MSFSGERSGALERGTTMASGLAFSSRASQKVTPRQALSYQRFWRKGRGRRECGAGGPEGAARRGRHRGERVSAGASLL